MSNREKLDPTKSYVLEETAIMKAMTIEELAELATRNAETTSNRDGGDESEECATRNQ